MTKKQIYIFLLLVFSMTVSAQQKQVITSVDKTKNKIGAQFSLTLKTTVDTASTVTFPSGKQFGQLEVIRDYKPDTVRKDAKYELVKRYGLTQFDSGKYTIPQLRVLIDKKSFLTDSIRVEIANIAVDTLQQKMYDIKDIVHSSEDSVPWWAYVIIVAALALIAFLVPKIIKKFKSRKEAEVIFRTPIEKATNLLQQLERKELWQKGEIKNYYSELTDIARNYIEEAVHIPAMESTTSELIAALRIAAVKKHMSMTPETVENLEKILRQADLVKFAKSKPLDFEIAEDRKKLESTIVTIDKAIPVEVVEEEQTPEEAEALRIRNIKKKKRKKILSITAFIVAFVAAFFIGIVATKGFQYVKDNVIGSRSKTLLEGEWVNSEYGNPAISVETPKVLKRMDAQKYIPKNGMALLKEFQMFGIDEASGSLQVIVSTNTYKSETPIDLHKALDGIIKTMELKGAQNIIVKQDEYETKEGISGLKAYGTATVLNPVLKESKKMYYEILLFGQQNGLQQIMVMHEEGDKFAGEISDRVINSVELKKAGE